MKISDEAVESACLYMFGVPPWKGELHRTIMRGAILRALEEDGYPKLIAEALDVMSNGGDMGAVYNKLCSRVYHDGGVISGPGGVMGD